MTLSASTTAVTFSQLTVTYQEKPALQGINTSLPKGKLIGIIGPNGAGKSTLIKAAMGLLPLTSGEVRLFGDTLEAVRRHVSYVPQRESVDWDFPASVFDVVLMGRYAQLGLFKRPSKEDREIALNSLYKVGMETFQHRQIAQLSGGQQQRVFLARAMAQEADLYFMDEPFAGVDAATETAILEVLRELTTAGKTVIVVHHDLQSAASFFEWVVLLHTSLIASGPVEEVFTRDLLQKTYGGRLNFMADPEEWVKKGAIAAGKIS